MFKIRKGSTRLVVILCKHLVIKFPRFYGLSSKFKFEILQMVWSRDGILAVWEEGLFGKLFHQMLRDFLVGVSSNICEGYLWLSGRPRFVHPSLCLILFNLQWYAGEILPSEEQVENFFKSLPEDGRNYLEAIDPHDTFVKNWRIVDGKLRLIDYGGKIYSNTSFLYLLLHWRKELEDGMLSGLA